MPSCLLAEGFGSCAGARWGQDTATGFGTAGTTVLLLDAVRIWFASLTGSFAIIVAASACVRPRVHDRARAKEWEGCRNEVPRLWLAWG